MKKTTIIITMIVALGATSLVFAQRPGKGPDGNNRIETLKKELNLTTEQEKHIQALMKDFREEMQAVRKSQADDREQNREAMKTLHEKHQAEIKKILTSEQQVKFKELMKDRKGRGHGPCRNGSRSG